MKASSARVAKLHSKELASIKVPASTAAVVLERLSPVLSLHVKRLSPHVPLADQMKALAFDAYTQGLLDGAQIGPKCDLPVRDAILGAA